MSPCQPPCIQGTQQLTLASLLFWGHTVRCVESIKFQKYQWMPTVLLGREVNGYLAGQLERPAVKFVFIAQALQVS